MSGSASTSILPTENLLGPGLEPRTSVATEPPRGSFGTMSHQL